MATIRPYEQQVLPQGQINSQASAADFGAGLGKDLYDLGRDVQEFAQTTQHDVVEAQDVTNVHVNMAKARAEWTQTMKDRADQAQPGDTTFAPKLMGDMGAYFQDFAKSVQTRRGQQVAATLAANMTTEFGDRAIGIQSELAARGAANDYTKLLHQNGSTVVNDFTQLGSVLAATRAAIDDPAGMFKHVDAATREKLKIQADEDLNFAAAKGFIRTDVGSRAFLNSFSKESLSLFNPGQKIVSMNAAPGGAPSISSGAMQWATQVGTAGASNGVNPNVLLAQIDKESKGNPNAVNNADAAKTGDPSIGLAQFQPATAAQYGIDPAKPEEAIKGQAAYMADLLKKYGGDYSKALAAYNWGPGNLDRALSRYGDAWQARAPSSVRDYVGTILRNSGMVAGTPDANAPAQPTGIPAPDQPAQPTSLPFKLTWKQQDQLVTEAIQLQHMQLTMGRMQREEAERAKKDAQESAFDGFLQRIYAPKDGQAGPTDSEIMGNTVMSPQQKQHLSDLLIQRPRQLLEKTHPVEFNRLYTQLVGNGEDATKTYNGDAIDESFRLGNISWHERETLMDRVTKLKDPTYNNFEKTVAKASAQVHDAFSRDIVGQMQPLAAFDASQRFTFDMLKSIEDKRKANEDPRTLFDPGSRDYILKPEKVTSYLKPLHQVVTEEADRARKDVKVGDTLMGFRFKGGNPGDKTNWEKI